MSSELATEAFLDLVERSGIVPADQMPQLLEDLEPQRADLDTSQKLADELVAREVLTTWQANKLLQGKFKGFLLGSYRILKPLGKGGMGTVFLAEHRMMRRRCAIKVLPSKRSQDESSTLERFYREAQAVAALDHVNIVRAYDVAHSMQDKVEIHYLVMEHVDGKDLQTRVEDLGTLDYHEAADLIRQAAKGLAHAHESGLVHRDVKPANLLLDSKGVVKVLDLGLARFFDDSEEASLTNEYGDKVLGTADYLAPEQALDCHGVDARADIYSLGQTFYFLLTGHPPFPEGSVAQRLLAHQMKAPEPIENQRPDAPPVLLAIIDRMTTKKPEDRYQSAEEVAEVLKSWLEGHAEDAARLSRFSRPGGAAHPATRARREPTRATSGPAEDTELELAPLDEDEPRKSGSGRLDVAAQDSQAPSPGSDSSVGSDSSLGSGTSAGRDSSLGRETPSDSSGGGTGTSPSDSQVDGAEEDELYQPMEDLPDLTSLEPESLADLLGSDALPPASVDLAPTSSSSVKIPTTKMPEKESEESVAAKMMGSPVVWIGLAGLVVVVLILAIVLNRPSGEEAPQRAVAGAPQESFGQAEPAAPSAEAPETPESAEDEQPGPEGERPPEEPILASTTAQSYDVADPFGVPSGSDTGAEGLSPETPGLPQQPDREFVTETAGSAPEPQSPETEGPLEATEEPQPEKIDPEALFAGITELSFQLTSVDKNQNSKLNLMVKQAAMQAAERARLKATKNASTRMNITLEVTEGEELAGVMMSANLECRAPEGQEEPGDQKDPKDQKAKMVEVWKHREQVATVAWRLLRRGTVPVTLRQGVGDFFDRFVRDFAKVRTSHAEPPEAGPLDDVKAPDPGDTRSGRF